MQLIPASLARPPAPQASDVSGYEFGKRILDFVLALVLSALTAPLILIAMILVKLTSRGPAVYSQVRLGRGAVPFIIYKIRTMRQDAESLCGARWSSPGDSRITPIGRWLRKTHIDELPQLWNVLRGDMSLVGPRPERPEFLPQLEQAIAQYRRRLLVRPGVTGLAQVQLPPDTDLESVRLKLAYDIDYVRDASLWLDLRICWATAFKVVGVSFEMIRRLFGLRGQDVIVARYKQIVAEQTARPSSKDTVRREPPPAPTPVFDVVGS
jgi:lipopolysaccharide/colanic/teichoic acid biosynthesis glycosyltransferase